MFKKDEKIFPITIKDAWHATENSNLLGAPLTPWKERVTRIIQFCIDLGTYEKYIHYKEVFPTELDDKSEDEINIMIDEVMDWLRKFGFKPKLANLESCTPEFIHIGWLRRLDFNLNDYEDGIESE